MIDIFLKKNSKTSDKIFDKNKIIKICSNFIVTLLNYKQ